MAERITPHGELATGQLSNGLRYVVLPNKTPPERFEAHLEVHAGSVDEKEHEQVGASVCDAACVQGEGRGALFGRGSRI